MKPSAVLLIDLENFYCSREDYCRNGPPPGYDRARFGSDLDKLLSYARSMTADRATGAELPFTVKRAYADFNVAKYPAGAPPHYYLRQLPDELLSQGVEPVQVFRLSRGGGGRGSKNAADMRMAMDATALLASAGHVEHFVLVTGDADFIPVILELKRHGHTVSVIGVTGATSPKIQRFVDNFELFEDLLAAEEVEARTGEQAVGGEIGQIAAAVRRLLARTHPLRFAAVKPLLSKELGHPFDPGLFGCDTTGDFLRENQGALGVVIRQGQHDYEIDLPGSAPNGANGSRAAPRPAPRPQEKAEKPAKAPEPHTAAHYRHLLAAPRGPADREGKVHPIPWAALVWACDAVVPLLAPPAGEPTHTTKLLQKLTAACDGADVPDLLKHVRLFYPTLRAALPAQGTDGVYALAAGASGEHIRYSVLGYVAGVLKGRLDESGVGGYVRADQLAAVFDPGPRLDEAAAEFAAALAEPAPEPAPAAPETEPPPAGDELHTPAGYLKLLKAGGPRGSTTETFKVLPVPWPSVVRVCDDAFRFLAPTLGGGPLPREQFVARLLDAGKDLSVDKYDQHVRRVLGLLRLSADVVEEGGHVALNPEVASGHDLRGRALGYLLELLQLRLRERGVEDPIRPQAFVAALEAGPLGPQLVEDAALAIGWLYRPEPDEPPTDEAPAEPDRAGGRDAAPDPDLYGEIFSYAAPDPKAPAAPRPEPDPDDVPVGFESGPIDIGPPDPLPEEPPAEPAGAGTATQPDRAFETFAFAGELAGAPESPPAVPDDAPEPPPYAEPGSRLAPFGSWTAPEPPSEAPHEGEPAEEAPQSPHTEPELALPDRGAPKPHTEPDLRVLAGAAPLPEPVAQVDPPAEPPADGGPADDFPGAAPESEPAARAEEAAHATNAKTDPDTHTPAAPTVADMPDPGEPAPAVEPAAGPPVPAPVAVPEPVVAPVAAAPPDDPTAPLPQPKTEPDSELPVFALLDPPPPAHPEPRTAILDRRTFIGSRPLPDVLPDTDTYPEIISTDRPVVAPERGSGAAPRPPRAAAPPPPPSDRMKPPPLPRRAVPPPLPPPPPESS